MAAGDRPRRVGGTSIDVLIKIDSASDDNEDR
jgi:hypothetical protein